jgi:type VI secretion system secreted protein VgrG
MAYIDGDPDRPIGFARNINGVMTPEYSQPANKTRMTIKTPSSPATGGFNELRLEDVAGSQHFDWRAEKDFIGEVVNDRTETIGNDESHTVKSDMLHSVEHDQTVSIGGNFKVTVGANSPLNVAKDRTTTVGGNETIEVGKVLNISTQGDETEDVGTERKTKAGEDGGAITRVVEETLKRTIGAGLTTTGKGDITTLVGDAYTEKIDGSKTTKTNKGMIKSTVSGPFKIDVTGEMMRKSTSHMGFSADRSKVTVTGATSFTSDERIAIQGNHIVIEADSSLTLTSGDLEIAMTPGSTKIKGKMLLDAKASITVTGNPDNITK